MLQAYSENIPLTANSPVQFNNILAIKGCSESLQGVSTIILNKCGVYKISVNASITPSAAGLGSIQLYKNGSPIAPAIAEFTAASGTTESVSFETYVQVENNNTPCPCSIPTTISLYNGEIVGTANIINIVVDKIC